MLRRPLFLTAGAALTLGLFSGLVSACTTGPTGGAAGSTPSSSSSASVAADAFPVTLTSSLGTVTISKEPTRIVALGTNDEDDLLALGVVPVGATKVGWGGNKRGSTDWTDARLSKLGVTGAQRPALLDDSTTVPVDDIAKLSPDLIMATNYSLTKQQYRQLSKIAPVVGYPGAPWVTGWQECLKLAGEATGRQAAAAKVTRQTDAAIAAAKKAYPQIQGKTFIWGALGTADLSSVPYYTPEDARPLLLTQFGMKNAPVITRLSKKGQFYGTVSAERAASLKSDVFLTYTEKASDLKTFEKNALIGQIPAIRAGHLVGFPEGQTAESGTVTTPLSIPYAIKHFLPPIAAALT